MGPTKPPVDYLACASEISLESFELARLNQIANLRKELREVMEEWIEAEVEARIARWVLDTRRAQSDGIVPFRNPLPGAVCVPESKPPVPARISSDGSKNPIAPRLGSSTVRQPIQARPALGESKSAIAGS